MAYRVKISDMEKEFKNAHQSLLKECDIYTITMHDIKNLWIEKYKVTPVVFNSRWYYLDFASEYAYTIFLIKWS